MAVCHRLKEARTSRGVTLDVLAAKTRIAKKYLQALEECRYEALPSGVYQKHFLKLYTKTLGIDAGEFVHQYEMEVGDQLPTPNALTAAVEPRAMANVPGIVKTLALSVLSLALLGYLGFQITNIVRSPKLELRSPADGLITTVASIVVEGQSDKEAQLEINGEQVVSDQGGAFRQLVDLQEGVNTITIKATKKHGRTTELQRKVLFEVPQGTVEKVSIGVIGP
ncbi:MAG: XRE family transcriptional regulator [Candidatus Magasanikbacteria bacterium]|nr:XRE family transcriptional regulator [Candidatus Magasanikbacteria bacterium]